MHETALDIINLQQKSQLPVKNQDQWNRIRISRKQNPKQLSELSFKIRNLDEIGGENKTVRICRSQNEIWISEELKICKCNYFFFFEKRKSFSERIVGNLERDRERKWNGLECYSNIKGRTTEFQTLWLKFEHVWFLNGRDLQTWTSWPSVLNVLKFFHFQSPTTAIFILFCFLLSF